MVPQCVVFKQKPKGRHYPRHNICLDTLHANGIWADKEDKVIWPGGNYANINKIAYKSKVETEDPWFEKLAIAAMLDPEYVTMIAHIENGTELNDIDKDSELANMRLSKYCFVHYVCFRSYAYFK